MHDKAARMRQDRMQARHTMRRFGQGTHKDHAQTGEDFDGLGCVIHQYPPQSEIVAIGKSLVEQAHIFEVRIGRIADNACLSLQFGIGCGYRAHRHRGCAAQCRAFFQQQNRATLAGCRIGRHQAGATAADDYDIVTVQGHAPVLDRVSGFRSTILTDI